MQRFAEAVGDDQDELIRQFASWFLRDSGAPLPSRPMTERPARPDQSRHHPLGKVCNHYATYGLSCNDYDDMHQRADYRCEICRLPEAETKRGKLVVDHHYGRRGVEWHVRGLLCDQCNALMSWIDGNRGRTRRYMLEPQARAYAANSWQIPGGDVRCSPHRHLPEALFACPDPCEARTVDVDSEVRAEIAA